MFKRFWWVFLAMLGLGAVGGLMIAAVVTYVMPKKYESQATLEIQPGATAMTPLSFGAEFEKIKSTAVLSQVVDNLDLTMRWGVDQEAAVRILKTIIVVRNIRGTDLISIQVRHTNREDASDITAEVSRVYSGSLKSAEKPDMAVPVNPRRIVIHEEPQISAAPVSPNVMLNLALGPAVGVILCLILAFPLIYLLNRFNPLSKAGPPPLPT